MELTVIQTKIYEIRGQKVMLDFDLAELYQVNTKRLNESVKRNSEKFPEDFMFRLSIEEWSMNWSQIATSSEKAGKGTSSPPLTSSKNIGERCTCLMPLLNMALLCLLQCLKVNAP